MPPGRALVVGVERVRVAPAPALPSPHSQRAEGRSESEPVTAHGRRFPGGGLSGRDLPPRIVHGLGDMTALAIPPPSLPPPARGHLGTGRGLRTTPGPVEIARGPGENARGLGENARGLGENARGLGENARIPMAIVGPHASTPAHVGTVPGPVTVTASVAP